ncbi:MAG: hypothetical protein E7301_00505 [Butyrivibrio sp.]|nr:hypothetical protein [Butyrivibrio sp.]
MKYYAGAVRSPGTKTDNQDAVMIKGFKLFKKNVVVMLAASVDSRSIRNIMPVRILPKLLSQKLVTKLKKRNARQTDAIVRSVEKCIDEMIVSSTRDTFTTRFKRTSGDIEHELDKTADTRLCESIANSVLGSIEKHRWRYKKIDFRFPEGKQELVTSCGQKRKSINISLLVLVGKDYYFVETGGENLLHITSTGTDTLRKSGRLYEGATLLMLTQNAKMRMTKKEMWELFAPQMCIYEGYIEEALREMADLVRRKGDNLPLTAAGVCIK